MWKTIKRDGKQVEVNVCPQCEVEFEKKRYCKPCDRMYAHADKPIIEKKQWGFGAGK